MIKTTENRVIYCYFQLSSPKNIIFYKIFLKCNKKSASQYDINGRAANPGNKKCPMAFFHQAFLSRTFPDSPAFLH